MFDPTAFENLKVVIEGAVYDKDLSGEILVTDRNDIVNLAKLDRSFEVSFIEQNSRGKRITATLLLVAGLENLAAELLPVAQSEIRAGCHVTVKFSLVHPNHLSFNQKIEEVLREIWGTDRSIEQQIRFDPFEKQTNITNDIAIHFNRLIYEDQIVDLTSMIDFMIRSMKELKKIFQ